MTTLTFKNSKINDKKCRFVEMKTIKLEKPNTRKLKVEEEPWQ